MVLIFLLSAGLSSLGAVVWRVLCSLFHGGRGKGRTVFASERETPMGFPAKGATANGEENTQLLNDLRFIGPNGFNHRGSLQVVKQSQIHQEVYLKS